MLYKISYVTLKSIFKVLNNNNNNKNEIMNLLQKKPAITSKKKYISLSRDSLLNNPKRNKFVNY